MTLTGATRRPDHGRRHNAAPATATAVTLIALLFGTAACGGSDESEAASSTSPASTSASQQAPAAWAEDVCSAITDWKSAVGDAHATLGDTANLSANGIRDAVDSVATATDSLVTDLKHLGPPDSAVGNEAQEQLSTLDSQLQEQQDKITSATNGSSTTV